MDRPRDDQPSYDTLRSERDLYKRLLDLGAHSDLAVLLKEALALIVEITGARLGYLELHDDDESPDRAPPWSIAHDLSGGEVQNVRAAISSGIIAQALTSGEAIVTSAALVDPRFSGRESVNAARIEKVLCVPIGVDEPMGVLYLQGSSESRAFSYLDQERAEIFVRHLAPLADRLLIRFEQRGDPTRTFRETLQLDEVIGRSDALAAVLRQVALIAPLDVNVLLTGESGTGKNQLARVIHNNGPRRAGPFVELNCAALPDDLIESELFGAAQGAHSTAVRRMPGKIAAAEGGTLVLDEIGEIAMSCQAKLLQLLQSREYFPLGSSQPVRADVRIIAATNSDLRRAVAERRFREDLLYRLEVLPIRVPSLAERRDDIPGLVEHFAAQVCDRHAFPRMQLTRAAVRAAQSAEWPGNIRQLAHAIEAAAIRAAGERASSLDVHHLFPDRPEPQRGGSERATFQEATRDFQASLLRNALDETGWNIAEVARRLDLTRSHVYNLMHAFGIVRQS